MEPLDSDIEYVGRAASRPSTPASRLSVMYIFPILGFVILLVFIVAAIFQLDISALVDNLVTLLVVLFFVAIAILFWAFAPRENRG